MCFCTRAEVCTLLPPVLGSKMQNLQPCTALERMEWMNPSISLVTCYHHHHYYCLTFLSERQGFQKWYQRKLVNPFLMKAATRTFPDGPQASINAITDQGKSNTFRFFLMQSFCTTTSVSVLICTYLCQMSGELLSSLMPFFTAWRKTKVKNWQLG